MTFDSEPDFFKAKQVAQLLGVDPKTVYTWVSTGRIAHIRTPGNGIRVRGDEVRRMLRGEPCLGQDRWVCPAQEGPEVEV